MLDPIVPAATLSDLHPPGTAFAPRSNWVRARWAVAESYRLDTATSHTLTVMGGMPLICHRAVATPLALDFLRVCGLSFATNLSTYETEAEAITLAADRVRCGERLIYVYPPPPGIDDDAAVIVHVPEYCYLNDKRNLEDLAGSERQPPRHILRYAQARELDFKSPVYLKAAIAGANGGGYGVRYCADAGTWASAIDYFFQRADDDLDLIVEDAIDTGTCWCMGVAVLADRVRFLGGAAQIFGAPTVQIGSRIDPSDSPPEEAVSATLEIAERARRRGYRGLAGFDMALGPSKRLYVFDLNFRLNASTVPLLLHASAVARVGGRVSETWSGTKKQPLEALVEAVRPFAESGVFVPTRFYDATPESRGISTLGGIAVADSAQEVRRLCKALHATLKSS